MSVPAAFFQHDAAWAAILDSGTWSGGLNSHDLT
jgi:hypothetical protein